MEKKKTMKKIFLGECTGQRFWDKIFSIKNIKFNGKNKNGRRFGELGIGIGINRCENSSSLENFLIAFHLFIFSPYLFSVVLASFKETLDCLVAMEIF